jgi:hypothetical protein
MNLKQNSTTFLKSPFTYKRQAHSMLGNVLEQTPAIVHLDTELQAFMEVTDRLV